MFSFKNKIAVTADVANMVLYLCSDTAEFITRENICIDGGMIKQMIYHGDYSWMFQENNNT